MSRNFSGTNQGVLIDPFVQNAGALTIACWIQPDTVSPASGMRVCGWSQADTFADDKEIGISTSGKLEFYVYLGSQQAAVGATTLTSGAWVHVAGVHNPAAGTNRITCWVNGVQDGSNNTSGNSYTYSTPIFEVGEANSNQYYPQDFDGRVADLQVWSVALIGAELQAVMRGMSIRPGNRLLHWPLWGVQSPEPDWSGNNYHGTVTGATRADHPSGISAVWLAPNPQWWTQEAGGTVNPLSLSGSLTGSGSLVRRVNKPFAGVI